MDSGWSLLAKAYRTSRPFDGQSWSFQSGQIGVRDEQDPSLEALQAYGYCLNVGSDRDGIQLSMFFLFRMGHPSLLIPWSDISVSPAEGVFFKKMRFDFRRVPRVSLYLRKQLGSEVIKHAEWYTQSAT